MSRWSVKELVQLLLLLPLARRALLLVETHCVEKSVELERFARQRITNVSEVRAA